MPVRPLRRLLASFLPSSAFDGPAGRMESCPPLARPRHTSWRAPVFVRGSRQDAALEAARLAFADALADVRSPAANDAAKRVGQSLSLHELWHLREEIFSLVAVQHDQDEASRRLAALNRHFRNGPGRAGVAANGPSAPRTRG